MSNNDILLGIELRCCPICGKEHNVEIRKRKTEIKIKDSMVNYDEKYYKCTNVSDDEDNEYISAKMLDENLLEAKDVYRNKKDY